MQPVDGGPVKIGFTDNLDARHRQLERHYGCELAILATMPGDLDTEAEIHHRFDHLRLGSPYRRRVTVPASRRTDGIHRATVTCQCEPRRRPGVIIAGSVARSEDDRLPDLGEYAAWVDDLAAHNRTTIAGLLDQALVKFAREGLSLKGRPPTR